MIHRDGSVEGGHHDYFIENFLGIASKKSNLCIQYGKLEHAALQVRTFTICGWGPCG